MAATMVHALPLRDREANFWGYQDRWKVSWVFAPPWRLLRRSDCQTTPPDFCIFQWQEMPLLAKRSVCARIVRLDRALHRWAGEAGACRVLTTMDLNRFCQQAFCVPALLDSSSTANLFLPTVPLVAGHWGGLGISGDGREPRFLSYAIADVEFAGLVLLKLPARNKLRRYCSRAGNGQTGRIGCCGTSVRAMRAKELSDKFYQESDGGL